VTDRQRWRLGALGVGIVLVGAALLAWHRQLYLPFIADDALISLRYAARLLDGHGLTWTAGEPVEGYSNLLWVLAVALVGAFGVDLIDAARGLGLVGFVGGMSAVVWLHLRRGSTGAGAALCGTLAIAGSAQVAVWSVGGLEQPLVGGLLACGCALFLARLDGGLTSFRAWVVPGVPLGLLCITRPDGPLFAALLGCALLMTRRRVQAVLGLWAAPALLTAGQLVFRLSYYGHPTPTSAAAKFHPNLQRASEGLAYVTEGLSAMGPLCALACVGLALSLRHPERRAGALSIAALATGWMAYICIIGGDIFPAWRHLLPVAVFFAFLVADGVASIPGRGGLVAVVLVAAGLGVQFEHQRAAGENRRAVAERWEWDGKVIGTVLKRAFGEAQPLLAVEAAGCLPYFSELPALDMLGLNDPWLPLNPPEDIGHGLLAHELGNGDYVLGREPDLVIFGGPSGGAKASHPSSWQMNDDPRFHFHYSLSRVVGSDPHEFASGVWFRRDSPKVGIQRTDGRVLVPGWFLNEHAHTEMRLGDDDKLGAVVAPGTPAALRGVRVPLGTWTVRVEPPSSGASLRLTPQGVAGSSNVFDVEAYADRPSWIGAVVLERRGQLN
jgi:arabinofuranosyltransferase